jgi:hypothetical protein
MDVTTPTADYFFALVVVHISGGVGGGVDDGREPSLSFSVSLSPQLYLSDLGK